MALSFKHKFHSAKTDGTDATKVQPSNWNDEHDITLAADRIIGRDSSAPGAAQELTCTALGRTILGGATIDALVAAGIPILSTGDLKPTLKTSADAGYIMYVDGTIGSASSGASIRANADCQALFTLIFGGTSDADAPILTSGGGATTRAAQGNVAAAWAANCRMSLPVGAGRAVGIAGSGATLTARALGKSVGAETHVLTVQELAAHAHTYTDPGHHHGYTVGYSNGACGYNGGGYYGYAGTASNTADANIGITIQNSGNSQAHNNMQPTVFFNFMVKL